MEWRRSHAARRAVFHARACGVCTVALAHLGLEKLRNATISTTQGSIFYCPLFALRSSSAKGNAVSPHVLRLLPSHIWAVAHCDPSGTTTTFHSQTYAREIAVTVNFKLSQPHDQAFAKSFAAAKQSFIQPDRPDPPSILIPTNLHVTSISSIVNAHLVSQLGPQHPCAFVHFPQRRRAQSD